MKLVKENIDFHIQQREIYLTEQENERLRRVEHLQPQIGEWVFNLWFNNLTERDKRIEEGLITSYPLETLVDKLSNKYDITPNYDDYTFRIKYKFNENLKIAQHELENIDVPMFNLWGWHISLILIDEKRFGNNVNFFNWCIQNEHIELELLFEPKYGRMLQRKPPKFLYHLTPKNKLEKIEKQGLVPKFESKRTSNPERIYFSTNINGVIEIMVDIFLSNKDAQLSLLEIDTREMQDVKFYIDPSFKTSGIYTLDYISPTYISTIKDDIRHVDIFTLKDEIKPKIRKLKKHYSIKR